MTAIVHHVVADSVVRLVDQCARGHLVARLVSGAGGLAPSALVGSHVVVVANGLVEDELKLGKCVGGSLDQELLQGPVPAFTL